MKTVIASVGLSLLILVVGCSKDKFKTEPRLEIKSYNTKTITKANGNEMKITINYFDKEGDMSQAEFFAVRERLNIKPPNNDKADTLRYLLPVFPVKDHGEILFELGYQSFLKESSQENDTIVFRIAVTDRAGHKSDTIQTSKLVIVN